MKNITSHTVTAENVDSESFHNLVILQKFTRYANPIAAIKSTKAAWSVLKDECGNIVGKAENFTR